MLFINSPHKTHACGVYQYGKRLVTILQKQLIVQYKEVETQEEYIHSISNCGDSIVVINYHVSLFPWLTRDMERTKDLKYYYIYHESGLPNGVLPHQVLNTDPTSSYGIPIPRPLFLQETACMKNKNIACPKIGSFGFGFTNKNFPKIVSMVQEQFDRAMIHLHIPFAYHGDKDGGIATSTSQQCRDILYKPGIDLVITHNFITDEELIEFLSSNDLNIFLYVEGEERGCSSVLDFALGVNTPIAISNSQMFRHIYNDSINAYKRPLIDIMLDSPHYIQSFRDKWSHAEIAKVFSSLI